MYTEKEGGALVLRHQERCIFTLEPTKEGNVIMTTRNIVKQRVSVLASWFLTISTACVALLLTALGVVMLGYALFYVSTVILPDIHLEVFHYVMIILAISCTICVGLPIVLLARNIQRSAESFSLLQFDEDGDEDDEFDGEEFDFSDDGEELNEFLKTLHKSRNIGPFIPSPKSMDDLCPCGSGLKYKDCCGKSWL
jgi:hypothetical protein